MERLTINHISVLLIEPSRAQTIIIERAIRRVGVEKIDRVDSGQAALEEAQRFPPDLIVSSFYLPDMTGSDLLVALRESPRTQAIPFILISSETKFSALDPVRQAGAVAILPKPFTDDQIRQAMHATLNVLDPSLLGETDVILDGLRVLLVDDSQLAREHLIRLLHSIGITEIIQAVDGSEALKKIETDQFDLVISDYNMPNIDGKALTEHIRLHSQMASVPILMVTSEQNQERLAALHASGVSAICNKPFDLKNMRDLIDQVVT